jgi:predicted ATPase
VITSLEVKGFKSLTNFELHFTPGLNVLIGPNGAGKSNICQALGLLSALAEGNFVEYILSLGGVAAIFSLYDSTSPEKEPANTLEIACRGRTSSDYANEHFELKYEYRVGLRHRETELQIFKETLDLRRRSPAGGWRAIIHAQRERKDEEIVSVTIRNRDLLGPTIFARLREEKRFELTLPFPSRSFLLDLTIFYICDRVRKDLSSARTWNIDPHLAKRSLDIVEPLTMLPDGRRLAGAIYSMERADKKRFDELNAFLSEILPRYGELKSRFSPDKLIRYFSVVYTDRIEFAAHSLPDGIVKIIALVVAFLSEKPDSTVIEEPENYLHPWACQWLIEYLRDISAQGNCILTTHSETILNRVLPNEIVVVTNESGATKAERLSNKKALSKAIQETGFGCGYHYLTGALGGVPE